MEDGIEITSSNNWHMGSIYEFCSVIYGAPFKSSLFNEESRGLPLIRIRDLKSCSPQIYTEEIHRKATEIHPGDLLIGMDAEFRPHIWFGKNALLNQRVCKIEPIHDISPYCALLLLRSELYSIESYKTGTTVSHIGKSDFDAMNVMMPKIDEMKKFSDIISPLVRLMVDNRLKNTKLSITRDLLLSKLMTGEINVSNLVLGS